MNSNAITCACVARSLSPEANLPVVVYVLCGKCTCAMPAMRVPHYPILFCTVALSDAIALIIVKGVQIWILARYLDTSEQSVRFRTNIRVANLQAPVSVLWRALLLPNASTYLDPHKLCNPRVLHPSSIRGHTHWGHFSYSLGLEAFAHIDNVPILCRVKRHCKRASFGTFTRTFFSPATVMN